MNDRMKSSQAVLKLLPQVLYLCNAWLVGKRLVVKLQLISCNSTSARCQKLHMLAHGYTTNVTT